MCRPTAAVAASEITKAAFRRLALARNPICSLSTAAQKLSLSRNALPEEIPRKSRTKQSQSSPVSFLFIWLGFRLSSFDFLFAQDQSTTRLARTTPTATRKIQL